MKALSVLAFGALALFAANYATAAPAKADNAGVYAGSNGVAIQVDYRDRGYYRGNYRRDCDSRWERRHNRDCWYGYGNRHHRYYNDYYRNYDYRYYNGYRHHRHWRDRDDYRY